MSEKLCVFCTHLEFYEGLGFEYESVPTLKCRRGHVIREKALPGCNGYVEDSDSAEIVCVENIRAAIQHAETCPDYEQVKV